jgi:putative membrane protein
MSCHPFENRRLEDTPMASISLTIETNLKEQLKEQKENFPPKYKAEDGIIF